MVAVCRSRSKRYSSWPSTAYSNPSEPAARPDIPPFQPIAVPKNEPLKKRKDEAPLARSICCRAATPCETTNKDPSSKAIPALIQSWFAGFVGIPPGRFRQGPEGGDGSGSAAPVDGASCHIDQSARSVTYRGPSGAGTSAATSTAFGCASADTTFVLRSMTDIPPVEAPVATYTCVPRAPSGIAPPEKITEAAGPTLADPVGAFSPASGAGVTALRSHSSRAAPSEITTLP